MNKTPFKSLPSAPLGVTLGVTLGVVVSLVAASGALAAATAAPVLPSSSSSSSSAALELGQSLSVAHTVVEVDAATVVAGCVVSKLSLTAPSRRVLQARLRHRDPTSPVEQLALPALAVGDDSQGRRCRANTAAALTLRAQPKTPQPGTRVRVAVEGSGFIIESAGVVVPCRPPERRVQGAVCVRSDTGRTMVGCVGDDQGQILISSRCIP